MKTIIAAIILMLMCGLASAQTAAQLQVGLDRLVAIRKSAVDVSDRHMKDIKANPTEERERRNIEREGRAVTFDLHMIEARKVMRSLYPDIDVNLQPRPDTTKPVADEAEIPDPAVRTHYRAARSMHEESIKRLDAVIARVKADLAAKSK